jgi:hypothetical protein
MCKPRDEFNSVPLCFVLRRVIDQARPTVPAKRQTVFSNGPSLTAEHCTTRKSLSAIPYVFEQLPNFSATHCGKRLDIGNDVDNAGVSKPYRHAQSAHCPGQSSPAPLLFKLARQRGQSRSGRVALSIGFSGQCRQRGGITAPPHLFDAPLPSSGAERRRGCQTLASDHPTPEDGSG